MLSVIVPARNATAVLPAALRALLASDLPREHWELIVVDDGSTDGTGDVAGPPADQVLSLAPPSRGPAFARNHGSAIARGEILVFVDADVCVHPSTLRQFASAFAEAPTIGAVFGAYDTEPAASGVVSQYRNLVHHYTHLQAEGDAETFWAGCGAVRRSVFMEAGGFDADRFPRPQIEDIELGHRIRDLGYRILLRPAIQGKHLKRWTLLGGIMTDVRDRGIPWMKLLLAGSGPPGRGSTLNLGAREKLFTAMVGTAWLSLCAALLFLQAAWALVAGALLIGVAVGNADLLRWFAQRRGPTFALAVIPLRLLYYTLNGISAALGWLQHTVRPRRIAPENRRIPASAAMKRGASRPG